MDKQEQDILEPMTQKVGYGDAEESRNTGTLVGFVLLNTKECDFERIKKNLKADWKDVDWRKLLRKDLHWCLRLMI